MAKLIHMQAENKALIKPGAMKYNPQKDEMNNVTYATILIEYFVL